MPELPGAGESGEPPAALPRTDPEATADPTFPVGRRPGAAAKLPTITWQPPIYRPRPWLGFVVAALTAAALTIAVLVLVGRR